MASDSWHGSGNSPRKCPRTRSETWHERSLTLALPNTAAGRTPPHPSCSSASADALRRAASPTFDLFHPPCQVLLSRSSAWYVTMSTRMLRWRLPLPRVRTPTRPAFGDLDVLDDPPGPRP